MATPIRAAAAEGLNGVGSYRGYFWSVELVKDQATKQRARHQRLERMLEVHGYTFGGHPVACAAALAASSTRFAAHNPNDFSSSAR